MDCGTCGTENRADRKFCLRCGTPLAASCPNCGASNEPDAGWCGQCGTRLGAAAATPGVAAALPRPIAAPVAAPIAERRLISVLFADLVGYTALAEGMDAEDARELLGRYFERSREIVERYGGTVEKFIGDAVMAVWGAPTAHEDDAERAVRAALDLVAAVPGIGGGRLLARAGVITGEAAVTLGATGQGMVAGDIVNTASRLQSVAPPGAVLVGEATFRAAGGAITFEPAGEQVLKGKESPIPAWRAQTVVGKVRGAGRSDRIEPPFVGREAEFSALKERLHATGRDGRARLVSITGVAGIGKSRLAWEFEKYLDGVVETVYWHHGRSPAYGDGLAFWALGEMVRRRVGIAERDDEATSIARLDDSIAEWIARDEERRWVTPRLRALLGLGESPPGPREELFAAWRAYFERIAERGTAVLVFEDLHWADPGLIDFIESMLEWSRTHPLLIVTLARPELVERRPTWGAGQRDFTALHLEPLPAAAMTELARGISPGLPDATVAHIVSRSEGIPLYAVELFRMLVDRGLLVAGPGGYRAADGVDQLEVPESLQALLAARLDALPAAERRLLQDASVLGKTFTLDAICDIAGVDAPALEPLLRSLVRRELLTIDADPRSPERGQYGFVGALVREVAYGTLARRDRRERHLAAARYFETLGDDELAGILANHYTAAYTTSQVGPEADAVAAQARIALRGAADRARSLGSAAQAIGYLDQAFQVTTEPAEVARLHEEIAFACRLAGFHERARREGREAVGGYHALGDGPGVVRASVELGQVLLYDSQVQAAMDVLGAAVGVVDPAADPALTIRLNRMLARAAMFGAEPRRAVTWCEEALAAAARLDDVEAIADLMVTRAWALGALTRARESIAELRGALELARDNGLVHVELRAINNLGSHLGLVEPRRTVALLRDGMALAERVGDADTRDKLSFAGFIAFFAGDWAWGWDLIEARMRDDQPQLTWGSLAAGRAILLAWRGRADEAEAIVAEMRRRSAGGTHQDLWAVHAAETQVALAVDDAPAAAAAASALEAVGAKSGSSADGIEYGGYAAALAGDLGALRAAIGRLSQEPARYAATEAWQRALEGALAARDGQPREAATLYRDALDGLHRAGCEFDAMLIALDAASMLGPDDALGTAAADEVRRFHLQNDAPAAVVLLERRLAADPLRRPDARVSAEAADQAGRALPQNVRTTS